MQYQFDVWCLDSDNYQLFYDGIPIEIRPKTFRLLHFFVTHPQRLLTREHLIKEIWAKRCVSDESLTTCIKELRKVLHDHARHQRIIATRHGLGYQFLPRVTRVNTISTASQAFYPSSRVTTSATSFA